MHADGRAKALVERILAFRRSGVGERGPLNLQAVIEETLELLAGSTAPDVRLDKHLNAVDAAIVGDATQLHQVAMNLCANALQAMENGGVLDVELDRAYVAQDRRLSHSSLVPGAYVRPVREIPAVELRHTCSIGCSNPSLRPRCRRGKLVWDSRWYTASYRT